MIYRIRVSAATGNKPVYRDMEVKSDSTLEELHDMIWQSFGLDGNELASFYTTDDEFHLIDEIPLMPMEQGLQSKVMHNTMVEDVLNRENPRLIYIYDFLNMWQFLVELLEEGPEIPGQSYPNLVYAHGQLPETPPDPGFEIEDLSEPGLDDEGFFRDPDDPFGDFYDYNDDEWN